MVDPLEHTDRAPTHDRPPAGSVPDRTPAGSETASHHGAPGNSTSPATPDIPPASTRPGEFVVAPELPCAFGDYELLEELGRGGMGVVYKAHQKSLDRVVALKMVTETIRASEEGRQRLGLEARAAAGLDHPNIVPVYDAGQHENYHYFTMAYVDGSTLAARAAGRGLPVAEAVRFVAVVAEAMDHVHRRGIIHRDLKPSNVLIDRAGRPRVSDFGLAKQIAAGAGLTGPGRILGTPSYMAPEQAYGNTRGEVGPLADVYALGGVLYYALTGSPPFTGESIPEILLQVVQEPPTPLRWFQPLVPVELEAICLKCLSKNPAERYPSAGALAEALHSWAARPPAAAESPAPVDFSSGARLRPVTPPLALAPQSRSPRRRVAFWVLVGATAAVAAALLVALYLYRTVPQPERNGARDWDVLGEPGRPIRRDFALRVVPEGGVEGRSGEVLLSEGSRISFEVEAERDSYLRLWTVDPQGDKVELFPSDYEKDNFLRAHTPRTIPNPAQSSYDIRLRCDPGGGIEHFVFVTSTDKNWQPPKDGVKEGNFIAFRGVEGRARWDDDARGAFNARWDDDARGAFNAPRKPGAQPEIAPPAVSETTIPYRVVPGRKR